MLFEKKCQSLNDVHALIKTVSLALESMGISRTEKIVTLLVEELLLNTWQYGLVRKKVSEVSFHIEVIFNKEKISLLIKDDASPFDPGLYRKSEPQKDHKDLVIGSMGIHLIKSFSDSWKYFHKDGFNINLFDVNYHEK